MKRLIEASEVDGRFVFSTDNDAMFSIDQNDLVIDSKELYETFFKNLREKPEYELHTSDGASKECKYVAGQFINIIKQITDRINPSWFQEPLESDFRGDKD